MFDKSHFFIKKRLTKNYFPYIIKTKKDIVSIGKAFERM